MVKYLKKWIDQLRWQRLPSFQKLANTLLNHLDGILNYPYAHQPRRGLWKSEMENLLSDNGNV
jgi:hypothetical protein